MTPKANDSAALAASYTHLGFFPLPSINLKRDNNTKYIEKVWP